MPARLKSAVREERRARALWLLADGTMTLEQVGARLGVSGSTVCRLIGGRRRRGGRSTPLVMPATFVTPAASVEVDELRETVELCGCGRDYLQVPLEHGDGPCPNPIMKTRRRT